MDSPSSYWLAHMLELLIFLLCTVPYKCDLFLGGWCSCGEVRKQQTGTQEVSFRRNQVPICQTKARVGLARTLRQ